MSLGTRTVTPRTPIRAVLPALLLAFVIVGCAGGDDADSSTEPTPSSGTSASPTSESAPASEERGGEDTAGEGATDALPFTANTEPDTAQPSANARVSVTQIRVGRHDGFDRVVLEVDGEGLPGWDVRYVDEARSQGSGHRVPLAGNAVLEVALSGVGYPYDTGVEEFPTREPVSVAATEVVTEVVFDSTYEGTTVVFVGTTERAPFRVYLLENPGRVVIEVAG